MANQEFRKALVIFMIPRGDAVFDFFWAMFVAVLMRYWKSENSGEKLIYEALTAIAMLLTVLVVISFSIAIKMQ